MEQFLGLPAGLYVGLVFLVIAAIVVYTSKHH